MLIQYRLVNNFEHEWHISPCIKFFRWNILTFLKLSFLISVNPRCLHPRHPRTILILPN